MQPWGPVEEGSYPSRALPGQQGRRWQGQTGICRSALLSQRLAEAGSILTAVAGFSSGNTVESRVLGLSCGYLVSCLLESVGF